ncbi:hypothetical protein ACLBOM_00635 [Escherichia coli]
MAWQPELEKYDYRSARQYVTGTLTGPDFARGLAKTPANWMRASDIRWPSVHRNRSPPRALHGRR